MSESISIQSMIDYCSKRLKEAEMINYSSSVGRNPFCPLVIVACGNEAGKSFYEVAKNLFTVWPAFRGEIIFLKVLRNNGRIEYSISYSGEDKDLSVVDANELQSEVDSLYGQDKNFINKHGLMVYYMLDSRTFGMPDEYYDYLGIMNEVDSIISVGAGNRNKKNMVFFLLNESPSGMDISNEIKRSLASSAAEKNSNGVIESSPVFLLSNHLHSGTNIENDMSKPYSIISSIIVLSDDNSNASNIIYAGNSVKTIRTVEYVKIEKPVDDIAKVIILGLIDGFLNGSFRKKDKTSESDISEKELCLTENGRFTVLDDFVEKNAHIPTMEQLEFFPLKSANTDKSIKSLAALTYNKFNQLTMGAVDCLCDKQIENIKNLILNDHDVQRDILQNYISELKNNISIEDIPIVSKDIFPAVSSDNGFDPLNQGITDTFVNKIKNAVSADDDIRMLFFDSINRLKSEVRGFLCEWQVILNSRKLIQPPDANILDYYGSALKNSFFNKNKSLIEDNAKKIYNFGDLRTFIHNEVEDIINSRDIYRAAFYDELEQRLIGTNQNQTANQDITNKLNGKNKQDIFFSIFNANNPVLSAVLIDTNTPLYTFLKQSLNPPPDYYNTGIKESVVALWLHDVQKNDLT